MNKDDKNKVEMSIRDKMKKERRNAFIKKIISFIIFLALIGVGVYIYQFHSDNGYFPWQNESETATQSVQVDTYQVVNTVYSSSVDISGSLEANETQNISFRSTGTVDQVYIEEGDHVNKGDLIITQDATSQNYDLAVIENKIVKAQVNGSKSDLDLLNLEKAKAEKQLENTKAYAVIDGVITDMNVSAGDYISAGDNYITINDLSKLKAQVEVDEINLKYIKVGMTCKLTFDSLPGVTTEATITKIPYIGRTTSEGIGVKDIEITIDNPPSELSPGFTFSGTIDIQSDLSMLIIPTDAITTTDEGSYVIKQTETGEEKVKVEIEYLGENYDKIVSGDVEEGDILILKQATTTTSETTNNNMTMGIRVPGAGGGGGMAGGPPREPGN